MDTTPETDLLSMFFKDIRKFPMFSKEEERKVLRRVQKGDLAAQSEIVLANQRFVVELAFRFQNNGVPVLDLINEGTLALIIAAHKYNLKSKIRFLSYAVWWIRQHMVRAIRSQGRLVHIPENRMAQTERAKKLFNNGKTDKEVSKQLKKSTDYVLDLMSFDNSTVSIYKQTQDNSQLIDILPNVNSEDPELNVAKKGLQDYIKKKLRTLTKWEREVVELYYGLNENEIDYNLKDLGNRYGVSKERIRQIRQKAIKKLQLKCDPKEFEGI